MIIPDTDGDLIHQQNFLCGVVEGFYGRPWTTSQRKRLFKRMQRLGMNTYLYAPKDDSKHRMYWRDLYTVEEADHLTGLIEAAEAQGVAFVYALSPGLDMTYSSSKDVSCLKRKLEQVSNFGCKAFALLFDDIEVDMCDSDKEKFQSFAQAQVSVTNEVYQHLRQPDTFLFCPTEYCATRAMPAVSVSEYLQTIGSKLLPAVDIMWTGPKVVSKEICVKSIEEVAKVLQRPPVIWDNIHANDYDQRRLFLGPYDGRSPEIIPYIRGVLTNPNCEFEANYIAFHTLAQWSQSNIDQMKRQLIPSTSPICADIKLETDGYASDEDVPLHSSAVYRPKAALKVAIKEWVNELYEECSPTKLPSCPLPSITETVMPASVTIPLSLTTQLGVQNLNELTSLEVNHPLVQPVFSVGPVNSLVESGSSFSDSGVDSELEISPEPMDCASAASTCTPIGSVDSGLSISITSDLSSLPEAQSSPLSSPKVVPSAAVKGCSPHEQSNCESCIISSQSIELASSGSNAVELMQVETGSACHDECNELETLDQSLGNTSVIGTDFVSSSCPQSTGSCQTDRLTCDDIKVLIELFYMPFEYGSSSLGLLNELHWLKSNFLPMGESRSEEEMASLTTPEQWQSRADTFGSKVESLIMLIDRLCHIPNKGVVSELFPYLWDMKAVLCQVRTFVSWLELGHVPSYAAFYMQGMPYTWANPLYKDHFSSGDQEPWVFRGGVQAELQRMLPFEGSPDLLLQPYPAERDIFMHKITPYHPSNQADVYAVCRQTCDDRLDGTEIFPDTPDLMGDKLVGAFVTLSPEFCFLIEDEQGVCGYMLAAPSAKEFHERSQIAWLPAVQEKYPKPNSTEGLSPGEEMIGSFYSSQTPPSETIYSRYPAVVRLDIIPNRCKDETVLARRALCCAVAALKLNGANGIFTEVHVGDHNTSEFYRKLGFCDISAGDGPEGVQLLGRLI